MKLPNRERAIIPETKVIDYLLSSTHPYGRHKAAFFHRFGFVVESWGILRTAVLQHADEHEVAVVTRSQFGTRYTVEGALSSPDGRRPEVRVVWFVEADDDVPRLVTVYPLPGRLP